MNRQVIASRIRELLEADADDVRKQVLALSTKERPFLVRDLVTIVGDGKRQVVERRKAALVIRELLADPEPVLSESDASQSLTTFAALAQSESDSDLLRSLLTLSALLTGRVPASDTRSLDATGGVYETLAKHTDPQVAELSSLLAKRLKSTRAVFTCRDKPDPVFLSRRDTSFGDIDLPKAARNLQVDASKDWLVDPWSWPEVDWLVAEGRKVVEERLRSNTAGYVLKLDVAKDSRSTRPALVMDPADRLAYQALIDKVSLQLVGHLPPWVYGWRLSRDRPEAGLYADNKVEWRRYTADLTDKRKHFRYAAHYDVRSFFASVCPETLLRQLLRQCRAYNLFERVEQFLYSWNSAASRTGLPQRFLPSSLLAQAYLKPLDDYLTRTTGSSNQDRVAAVRWMDDIWLFSNDEQVLNRFNSELAALLDQLGLEFNSEKTRQFDSRETPTFLELVTTSGDEDEPTPTPRHTVSAADIDRQIDKILAQAEEAPRPNFSFLTASMRAINDFSSLVRFESLFDDLPHVANLFAPLLRISGRWVTQEDWYLSYLRRQISPTDWSIEAWAQMFPSHPATPPTKVANAFIAKLNSFIQATVVPRSCHLLAAWMPAAARTVFSSVSSLSRAFEYRGLAFAGLECSQDRTQITDWLAAFPETTYLVDLLRSRGFAPFPSPPTDDPPTSPPATGAAAK